MNPLMAVRVEPGPPSVSALLPPTGSQLEGGAADQGFGPPGEPAAEALRSLVSRYDTVVACGLPLREVAALDDLCRQLGKQLFAGEVRGASSFAFVDLGPRHTYTVKGNPEEKVVEYSSFRDAMKADLKAVNKRTHPLYLALRACWEFEEAHCRPAAGPADVAEVRAAVQRLVSATSAGNTAATKPLVPEALVEGFVLDRVAVALGDAKEAVQEAAQPLGELAPVCAVVGGVVANNVLRAVSHFNPPLRNLFCYSYLVRDGLGVEECF
ncbi:hypothetical protein Vretifemale_10201 [Volvox reticuliferus]|nr:hypothetical protein Vretifemale_10201 [Volvox reticuliferus]